MTRRTVVLPLLLAVTTLEVKTYRLVGPRWARPMAIMSVGLEPNGSAWSHTLADALGEWTAQNVFRFDIDPSYWNPCVQVSPPRNGAKFSAELCDHSELGSGVYAVTVLDRNNSSTRIVSTHFFFNQAVKWDVHHGSSSAGNIDFRRVALHEGGHALGLDDEDDAPAIMHSSYGSIEMLQADDIAGLKSLYY